MSEKALAASVSLDSSCCIREVSSDPTALIAEMYSPLVLALKAS